MCTTRPWALETILAAPAGETIAPGIYAQTRLSDNHFDGTKTDYTD